MDETTTVQTNTLQIIDDTATTQATETALVETELLVEEISIDGMCGVY